MNLWPTFFLKLLAAIEQIYFVMFMIPIDCIYSVAASIFLTNILRYIQYCIASKIKHQR